MSHTAPEVFTGRYGPKCDLWSVGVIAYLTLSGGLPFTGDSTRQLVENVRRAQLGFVENAWASVSSSAMCFVKKLLNVEVSQRYTALQALADPWLATGGSKARRRSSSKDSTRSCRSSASQVSISCLSLPLESHLAKEIFISSMPSPSMRRKRSLESRNSAASSGLRAESRQIPDISISCPPTPSVPKTSGLQRSSAASIPVESLMVKEIPISDPWSPSRRKTNHPIPISCRV